MTAVAKVESELAVGEGFCDGASGKDENVASVDTIRSGEFEAEELLGFILAFKILKASKTEKIVSKDNEINLAEVGSEGIFGSFASLLAIS